MPKIRVTDWNALLTSTVAGWSDGPFHFVYDEDGPSLRDYYLSVDDIKDMSPEERDEAGEAFIADCLEVGAIIERAMTGWSENDPHVSLAQEDFERLCELARKADENIEGYSNLVRHLVHEDDSAYVKLTERDWADISDLAYLLIRDMPANEPKRLDYRFILDHVTELNADA